MNALRSASRIFTPLHVVTISHRCVRTVYVANRLIPINPQWDRLRQQRRAFSRNYLIQNQNQPGQDKVQQNQKQDKDQKVEDKEQPAQDKAQQNQKLEKDQKVEETEATPVKEDPRDVKIAELVQLTTDLRNNLKLSLAETENVRKRLQKDIDKAREFGVEKLVKNLFAVTDTINICLNNKPDFSGSDVNTDAKIAFDALEATKKQFLSIFKDSYGIEEYIPKLGDPFDPMIHNALFEVDPPAENPKISPGTVGLNVKSGWKRQNLLLRAASVGVVKQKQEEMPPNVKEV